MTTHLSRRRLLQTAAGATVVGGLVGSSIGAAPADAAIRTIGSVSVLRLWGKKSVRQRILGTSRYRYVKVPRTKGLYSGTTRPVLNRGGLCHWIGTPAPLENGNCVLFGHRTTAGGPLRYSHRLVEGDEITLNYGGRSMTYYVVEPPLVIAANDFYAVGSWGDPSVPCITLVACTKLNKMPTSSKYRLLIRAKALVEAPLP